MIHGWSALRGPTMDKTWKSDLERWLAPLLGAFRHKARARMCPVYVAGLIGAGDRKSVQPMAARDGEVGYDQLHHFIASGVWDAAPLEKALLAEADRMVGGADAWLIVDDTALPKKGEHSVGVAPQYASSLGKTANCQSLVSLTLASREVPVMVGQVAVVDIEKSYGETESVKAWPARASMWSPRCAAVEAAQGDVARGTASQPSPTALELASSSAKFLMMPSLADRQGLASVKLLADIPDNRMRELPVQRSVLILVWQATGACAAIIHGQIPTRIRTAAASAVATRHLARPDSRILGLIGAGDLAVEHVNAIMQVRPIRTCAGSAAQSCDRCRVRGSDKA